MPAAAAPVRDIGVPDEFWAGWLATLGGDQWETTADLIWPQSVTTYGRMRHDPQLRGVLMAYLLPVLRATWVVDPAGCRDEVVQHVADDLGIAVLGTDDAPGPARRRGVSWARHLRSAAYDTLVYGHMPFELRYRIDSASPGGCHLDHLGQRMPWTIAGIDLNRDGTIAAVRQNTQQDPIPANRLIWYCNQQEGANWAGVSMLRAVYPAWLLKHEMWRVHGTSIRRFGMGIPSVEAPPGGTTVQVAEAMRLASTMRAGDQAGAGLPHGYTFKLTGITGSVPDALAFIRYLDQSMAKMALAGLIELGQTETGSRALGQTFLDLFILSLQAVADETAETATSGQDGLPGIVTDLVDQNWGEDEPAPRVVCTDVGSNYEVTADALARLTEFGALAPDAELDAWIRTTWRLPQRKAPAPAAPPDGLGGPPGGPGGAGLPVPPAPAARRGRRARAAGLRRQLTAAEARSGFQPAQHQADWQAALAQLVTAYRPVVQAQGTALAEQVRAAVKAGKRGKLGSLAAPVADGVKLIADAMAGLAQSAALALCQEAASQGHHIDIGKVKISEPRLGQVADARARLHAAHLEAAAGVKALQVVRAAPPPRRQGPPPVPSSLAEEADLAAAEVEDALAALSEVTLFDQLGAALTAAQNAGRAAVLEADAAAGGTAIYVATEILDDNTCGPCEEIDGTQFASLDEAEAAYPAGGYLDCEGGMRCRGTAIAVWGEEL